MRGDFATVDDATFAPPSPQLLVFASSTFTDTTHEERIVVAFVHAHAHVALDDSVYYKDKEKPTVEAAGRGGLKRDQTAAAAATAGTTAATPSAAAEPPAKRSRKGCTAGPEPATATTPATKETEAMEVKDEDAKQAAPDPVPVHAPAPVAAPAPPGRAETKRKLLEPEAKKADAEAMED